MCVLQPTTIACRGPWTAAGFRPEGHVHRVWGPAGTLAMWMGCGPHGGCRQLAAGGDRARGAETRAASWCFGYGTMTNSPYGQTHMWVGANITAAASAAAQEPDLHLLHHPAALPSSYLSTHPTWSQETSSRQTSFIVLPTVPAGFRTRLSGCLTRGRPADQLHRNVLLAPCRVPAVAAKPCTHAAVLPRLCRLSTVSTCAVRCQYQARWSDTRQGGVVSGRTCTGTK